MPALTIPYQNIWHRFGAIGYGAILLLWLSTEENAVWLTVLLGTGLALVVEGLFITHRLGDKTLGWRIWMPGIILLGVITGLASVFGTILLMVFKNVQHSHAAPDFSRDVVEGIFQLAPAWALSGGLLGGAVALAILAVSLSSDHSRETVEG
jgi:hypothetical protein